MKNNLFRSCALLTISIIALLSNTASAHSKDSTKSKTSTVVFTATNMTCKTDSKMVETALYRKKGVKSVKIDGETITVIYYPTKVTVAELSSVIEGTGSCEDPNAKIHEVKVKTQ